ncbi:hypothetical protein T265_15502, partial [Opisthorchis viverrini]
MHTNKAPLLHIFGPQTITVSIQQNGNSFRRDVQSTSNGRVLIVRTHQSIEPYVSSSSIRLATNCVRVAHRLYLSQFHLLLIITMWVQKRKIL